MSDKMAQPPWIELIIPTGQLCQQALVKNLRKIDGGDTHFIEVGAVKALEARIEALRVGLDNIMDEDTDSDTVFDLICHMIKADRESE